MGMNNRPTTYFNRVMKFKGTPGSTGNARRKCGGVCEFEVMAPAFETLAQI